MADRCPGCNAYIWSRRLEHVCHPMWVVQSIGWAGADDGDDIDTTVRAVDADDAASDAVEEAWEGGTDPTDEVRVKVRQHGSDVWEERIVSGEPTIDWSAREPS